MPPRLTWSNLLPGLIALAVVVSIAIGVLMFAGVGGTSGETIRLHVVTDQAQGVMGGTEVWLLGQKVGTVERIEFLPPHADTARRVVLVLDVQERDAGMIRSDSRVEIRTGGTVIGPAVVYVSAGTPRGEAIGEGDTLLAGPQADAVASGSKLMAAMSQDVKPLLADARTVMARVRRRRASLTNGMTEVHDGEVEELRGTVSRARAAFALPAESRAARARAVSALARADSIRELLRSPTTSIGRFRRDSSLGVTVALVRDEIARVRVQMDSVDGNFGRLSRDSSVTRALAAAQRELTLLMDDFRRRPHRYIAF